MRVRIRVLVAALVIGGSLFFTAVPVGAHAALEAAEPFAGAVVEEAPTLVRLTFSERPELSVSRIEVLDDAGSRVDAGPVTLEPDGRTVRVGLERLVQGAYTVQWRVVSAVDGHPTSGVHAFGVGVLPDQPDSATFAAPGVSHLEVASRWLLLAGLVVLLGAAVGIVTGFAPRAAPIAAVGWAGTVAGLLLLAECQRRLADASWSELAATPVGRALAGRGVALVVAGLALIVARRLPIAQTVVALAAAAAMAVHVAFGHAAAATDMRWANIGVQWAHLAAAGVWLGGLVALLRGLGRGARPDRFAAVSLGVFGVLVVAGVVAGVREVRTWGELTGTGYGRALLLKSAAVAVAAGLAALNRWRLLPQVDRDARPLRRSVSGEVVLGSAALVAAAVLAAMSPPAAARAADRPALVATGHDAATSMRARLTASSAQAGPNRFVVRLTDYDSGERIDAERVALRFTPIDDPAVPASTLDLDGAREEWIALGNGLAFEGRWRVDVVVEDLARTTTVPLVVSTTPIERPVSVVRPPDGPAVYAVDLDGDEGGNTVQLTPSGERAGPTTLRIEWLGLVFDELEVDHMALTMSIDGGTVTRYDVERESAGVFTADVDLHEGTNTVTMTARTRDGQRWRGAIELDVQ